MTALPGEKSCRQLTDETFDGSQNRDGHGGMKENFYQAKIQKPVAQPVARHLVGCLSAEKRISV